MRRLGAVPSFKFGAMPSFGATGTLAWPYKIAVVAVMALVAGGTLVTFGSAGAETPSSSAVAALPGSDEASPSVEGQVLPSNPALLNSADLLATLNLTDYSPGVTDFSLLDDDEDSDEDSDDGDDESDEDKKKASPTPTPKPSSSSGGGSTDGDSDGDGDGDGGSSPTPTPEPEPECEEKKVWVPASGSLRDGDLKLGHFETQEVCD